MKLKLTPIGLMAAIGLACMYCTVNAVAQDAAAPPAATEATTTPTDVPAAVVPPAADTAAQVATPIIVTLAQKYSWLVTVLMVIGIMRVVFKPLVSFWEAVAKATPTDSDDKFLAKCQESLWYRWTWWALDWLGSIKPPRAPTTTPGLTKAGPVGS